MAKPDELQKAWEAEDWPTAERLLRKEVKKKKPNPEAVFLLGKALEMLGKPGQALTFFKRAAGMRPDYADAWAETARMLNELGDPKAALPLFEKAQRLDPKNPYSQRNIARIAMRLGLWDKAETNFADHDDDEALLGRYRLSAEQGRNSTRDMLNRMLDDPEKRPLALRAMVRPSRGSMPRRIGPL